MLVSTAQQMPRQNSALHQHKDHKVPNLFWRSVSTDTLRANERYVALPPVGLLSTTEGPVSHRYVRQDSALWTELHDGMLTTGRLKQALGMHEAKAAQVVGIHPGSRGSSHLLSAYFHLLTTAATTTSSSTDPSSSSSTGSNALHPNEAARQQFNQQLAAAAAAGGGTDSLPAWMSGKSRYNSIADLQQLCEKVASAGDIPVKLYWGKVQEAAALFTLLLLFPAAVIEEVGLFEVDLRNLPASWDSNVLNDSATTDGNSVMTEFNSVATNCDLTKNNDKTSLPRLGASPDGLLVHRVEFTPEDLQLAADRLRARQQSLPAAAAAAASGQIAGSGSSSSSNSRGSISATSQQQQQQGYSSSSSTADGRSEPPCSDQQIVQCLLRQAFDAVPCAGVRPPVGVPTPDASSSSEGEEDAGDSSSSSDQPSAAAGGAAAAVSSSTAQPDVAGLSFQMDKLSILQELDSAATAAVRDPAPAAAAAAAAAQPAAAAAGQQQPGSLAFQPVGATVMQLLQRYVSCSSSSSPASPAVAAAAADGSSSSMEYSLYVREVVEVKNHCPFAFLAKRKGKKGRVNVSYSWRPRGPAARVHPQWVPQLQMHMLATGCESALLVSRCPETNVRVFRMWRDDAYLQTMMQILKVLQTECVIPQIRPSADLYSKVPGYKAFLHRTSAVARSAVCIAAGDEQILARIPAAADGGNVPKFW